MAQDPLPNSLFTSRASAGATVWSLLKSRFRLADFFSRLWLFIAWRRRSFPAPVTLNRFFAALFVFCFGIVFHSCVLVRPEQHDHVPAVALRIRFVLADLCHVIAFTHP